MNVKHTFEVNILKNKLFTKKNHLLLAISAGIDSVVLAHLLKKCDYKFSLAHCNFNLRDKESDADEQFCQQLASQMGVNIYINSFDTSTYAKKNHLSIQMAARDLRYAWFTQLSKQHKFDYILTAHHANDLAETMLINLIRGTGIKGLTGIAEKRTKIIRPLLGFNKVDIEAYAKAENINYRQDQSNFDDKYERNFIRLNIIPALKKLNPSLESTFIKNAGRFKNEALIVQKYLETKSREVFETKGTEIKINLKRLKECEFSENILHFILGPLNFNQTQLDDILICIQKPSSTGKLFYSGTHRAAIDRQAIVIHPIKISYQHGQSFESLTELKKCKTFTYRELKSFSVIKSNELVLTPKQLLFPITLRVTKQGDRFIPFGMTGFKLLSDFMREQKMNIFEKEECRVLVNGNGEIIWVLGYRSDERYRVSNKEEIYIKLRLVD